MVTSDERRWQCGYNVLQNARGKLPPSSEKGSHSVKIRVQKKTRDKAAAGELKGLRAFIIPSFLLYFQV